MGKLWGSGQEASREKDRPLRKHTNKDYLRCLTSVWSMGITIRGLKELTCENTKSTKIDIFIYLFIGVP